MESGSEQGDKSRNTICMEEEEAGTASLLCYALCLSLKLVCVCECVFVLPSKARTTTTTTGAFAA